MNYNQKWDYPTMEACAKKLQELKENSLQNQAKMSQGIEHIKAGMVDAEVGRSFALAFEERLPDIKRFAICLDENTQLLRQNIRAMENADMEIATSIKQLLRR